jgi:RNA polymerase sigma factor (sigma-70 family)
MIPQTDEDLYAQLLIAPNKAFQQLYDRHSGPLFRFIYRFTVNKELAEEILHDIFTQLLSGKFMLGPEANLKSWLYTLAKNKSLNCIKKASFEIKNETLTDSTHSGHDLESQTIFDNGMQKLACAEKNLPDDLRQTWLLKKQGLDYKQIASHLSIPVGTVKSRFHRLVVYLKKELNNES